jgi:single-strand DNA-binding protein
MTQAASRKQATSQKKSGLRMQTQEVWTRNEVIFMGRLGRDPEMIYTNSGKAKTTFSLAVNQGKDKDAMWLNVVCWEDVAEEVAQQACKGALVQVDGRLVQRVYQGKYYHDVVASSVEVIKTPADRTTEEEEGTDSLGDISDHPF